MEFVPHPLLRNPHLMTIAPAMWVRRTPAFRPAETRLFDVAEGVQVLARCHWQTNRRRHATLIILHGLEGSAESHYVVGIAAKAFNSGMNVVRLNLRNCGGTTHLTPTLYNAGLSEDLLFVVNELKHKDGLAKIFLAGYSLGGNICLKAAGELGDAGPDLLAGVCAVSPSVDLMEAVNAIERPENHLYQIWFLRTMKMRLREKSRAHPDIYDEALLQTIETIRQFDDLYTAPTGGYGDALNYYKTASAKTVMPAISVPTLVIAAEDDPLVPYPAIALACADLQSVKLLGSKYGGHAGFIHRDKESDHIFDRFWAENRVIAFCLEVMSRWHGALSELN